MSGKRLPRHEFLGKGLWTPCYEDILGNNSPHFWGILVYNALPGHYYVHSGLFEDIIRILKHRVYFLFVYNLLCFISHKPQYSLDNVFCFVFCLPCASSSLKHCHCSLYRIETLLAGLRCLYPLKHP